MFTAPAMIEVAPLLVVDADEGPYNATAMFVV